MKTEDGRLKEKTKLSPTVGPLPIVPPDSSTNTKEPSSTNRLTDYLRAPESIQEAFDRRIKAAVERQSEWDADFDEQHRLDWNHPDPELREVFRASTRRRRETKLLNSILGIVGYGDSLGVEWDEGWSRRARNARRRQGKPQQRQYDREALLAIDLREAWEDITGEPIHRGRATCPNPEHEDRYPDCGVRESDWRCFACGAHGTIIDLGAIVWGIKPQGSGYFRVADRIMGAVG